MSSAPNGSKSQKTNLPHDTGEPSSTPSEPSEEEGYLIYEPSAPDKVVRSELMPPDSPKVCWGFSVSRLGW